MCYVERPVRMYVLEITACVCFEIAHTRRYDLLSGTACGTGVCMLCNTSQAALFVTGIGLRIHIRFVKGVGVSMWSAHTMTTMGVCMFFEMAHIRVYDLLRGIRGQLTHHRGYSLLRASASHIAVSTICCVEYVLTSRHHYWREHVVSSHIEEVTNSCFFSPAICSPLLVALSSFRPSPSSPSSTKSGQSRQSRLSRNFCSLLLGVG